MKIRIMTDMLLKSLGTSRLFEVKKDSPRMNPFD